LLSERHNEANYQIFSSFLIACCELAFVAVIFGTVRFRNELDFFSYLFFPLALVMVVLIGGGLFSVSSNLSTFSHSLLCQFKGTRCRNSVLKREIKSLHCFGVSASPLTYLKKWHWLALIRAGSDYTIAVLELYK